MGHPDVGDQSDGRTGQPGQRLDLARMIHTDFPDADLILRGGRKDGQGQADVIVQVALGFVHHKARCGHRSGKILGAGFAIAPGQADHARFQPSAMPRSQLLQSAQGVIHPDQRECIREAGNRARNHRTRSPGGRSDSNKVMTVEIFPDQSPIKIPRLQGPGVLADRRHRRGPIAAEENTSAGGGQSMESGRVHDQAALPRIAADASATSSKGILRFANS